MLRTDGQLIPLGEDEFELDRVWMDHPAPGVARYYFGWQTSIQQALRLVLPDTPFSLTNLFMWGGPSGSIGAQDAPPLETVGAVLAWLEKELEGHGDLIDLTCVVGQSIEVSTHDNTEVTLKGATDAVCPWVARLLESRGFDAVAVMGVMDQHAGEYLAVRKPDGILGAYGTFEALNKAHPER